MGTNDAALQVVQPGAREFFSAGLSAIEHACAHSAAPDVQDATQVVLSLAHGAEMLCKGLLLHRGESIHDKGNRTISLRDALGRIGAVKHAANMLVLVDRRDAIQHAAAYMDPNGVRNYLDMARGFADDLLRSIPVTMSICPDLDFVPPQPVTQPGDPVDDSPPGASVQQRDAAYGDGVLVWAQGTATLRVRVRMLRETRWLTPEDQFEYMPKTDGTATAVYRQSGGIVIYDMSGQGRRLLTDTGGPGAIEDGVVAAQGIGIPDGLGGGIWLVATDGSGTERLSEGGDSPQLSDGLVVWQTHEDGHFLVRGRPVVGHGDSEVLVRDARNPALHGKLLAWTDTARRPSVYARDLETGEQKVLSEGGLAPYVHGAIVAFLEVTEESYDVRVVDWLTNSELIRIPNVGFPVGRGPILTEGHVIWESKGSGESHQLWRLPYPVPR